MTASNQRSASPAIAYALSVYSIAFLVAAVYHAVELWRALIADGAVLFHSSFVLIDLFMALAVWRRLPGLLLLVAVLTAEQLYAHGSAAWIAWHDARRIDAISCIVVIAMPALLVLVALERAAGGKVKSAAKEPPQPH